MTCRDCLIHDICEEKEKLMLTANNLYELMYQNGVECSCEAFKNKADVIEIDKVAEILADITGIAPCEMVGTEWLFDCCEHIGYCCATSDSECWVQYFKHYKERSENDG